MKTGGTSLSRLLRSQFDPQRTYPQNESGGAREKLSVWTLLQLGEQRLSEIEFYSVHMPAWVADRVAPDHLMITLLREPVARTVSHLRHIARADNTPDDLEEIYEDPQWRDRVSNYQTRMLSETEQDYLALARTAANSAGFGAASRAELSDLKAQMTLFMRTGVVKPTALTPESLDIALGTLERMDEAGVTEDLEPFVQRLAQRMRCDLPSPRRLNVAANEHLTVAPSLEARIRDDSALDLELYERAREGIALS